MAGRPKKSRRKHIPLGDVLGLTEEERRELKPIDTAPATVDPAMVQAWAQADCSASEMAGMLGVSADWFDDYRRDHPEIDKAMLIGRASTRYALRNAQMREALAGNVQMLIWLGKQMLGQSDKVQMKSESTVSVVLDDAMRELRDLSKDDLIAMRRIMIEGECETIEE